MESSKSISIMQPYIFPYIGYFHLIESCETFVFYDDVNYIKRSWINRNRILLNEKDFLFIIPISKISQNKFINELKPIIDEKWKKTFFKNLEHAYRNAPYYKGVIEILEETFKTDYFDITDLCIKSIEVVYTYLEKEFQYIKSSNFSSETKGMKKADRLIAITKKAGYNTYINAIGGQSLYSKEYFKKNKINLSFIKSNSIQYKQYNNNFIPNLSIIDILMFNDKDTVKHFFNNFELI